MRFILSLLIFTCFSLFTEAQKLPLETYTPANGLVDARVTNIFQDSKGRMFFLTRQGFSIFDGQHFDNYGDEEEGSGALANGACEYPGGTVRIFCFDGAFYDIRGNKVIRDTSQKKLLLEFNQVFTISPDERIILTNYHLLKEKKGTLQKLHFPTPASDSLFGIERCLVQKPWIVLSQNRGGNFSKIYLYNYETQEVSDSMPGMRFSTVSADQKQNLYAYTDSWKQLDNAALKQGKLKLNASPFVNQLPAAFQPSTLWFDKNDNIWLLNSARRFCHLLPDGVQYYGTENGLLENSSFAFQDVEKNYWFVSESGGVQKLQQSPINKYPLSEAASAGPVRAENNDEKGNTFIHTDNALLLNNHFIGRPRGGYYTGIFYWNNQYWEFTDYKTLKGSRGTVFHIEEYVPGYQPKDFQTSYPSIDREGRLIISGTTLFIIHNQLRFYAHRPNYYCDNVVVDAANNYWVFDRGGKASVLQWQNGKLVEIYSKTFTGLTPRRVVQWDEETFLVGARIGGIKILKWKNNELTITGSITKKQGLSDNFVYSLCKKNTTQLLAGTGTGLDLITMSSNDTLIENLSIRNNIFSPFVNITPMADSSFLCRSGEGTLYNYRPSMKTAPDFNPVVFFRSIKVNDAAADSLNRFSWQKNNFSFSVSAPSFFDNRNIKYEFVLNGGERQWVQYTNLADFTINNLPPGNYSLTVTVHYPGKVYPPKKLMYDFVINQPVWKQWWFIILVALLAGVIFFYFIRNYYRRKLEKQQAEAEKLQAVEKERTRIATDMHDDIGVSLSRIKFLSEKMMLNKTNDTATQKDLEKVSAYSSEMAQSMNEIVWALNQRYDSLEDLVNFCRAYAADFLQDKNIELHFSATIQNNKMVKGEIRRNLFLVLKEALNNTVKYAGANAVTIHFEQGAGISMQVSDNGKGIDINAIRPFANGIENMKKRITGLGGAFEIYNKAGTVLIAKVPI